MIERHSDIIENLKHFIELSSDEKKHMDLLNEKKAVLYAATLLDKDNLTIIRLCLNILENFVANEKCHYSLISTFRIYESVEALAIRIRNIDEKIYKRAQDITEILRNSAPPSFNTRSKKKKQNIRSNVFLLYIEELNKKNQEKLEKSLVKIRGVISFLIDLEMSRVTVRICPNISIVEIVEKINSKCSMKPMVVTKNKNEGNETLCDVLHQQTLNDSYLLEYPDEFQPNGREIIEPVNVFSKKGGNILKNVIEFWNESFYW